MHISFFDLPQPQCFCQSFCPAGYEAFCLSLVSSRVLPKRAIRTQELTLIATFIHSQENGSVSNTTGKQTCDFIHYTHLHTIAYCWVGVVSTSKSSYPLPLIPLPLFVHLRCLEAQRTVTSPSWNACGAWHGKRSAGTGSPSGSGWCGGPCWSWMPCRCRSSDGALVM